MTDKTGRQHACRSGDDEGFLEPYEIDGWDLPSAAIVKLHHWELGADGCPRETEPFLHHLDAPSHGTSSTTKATTALTLEAARSRLATEQPRQSVCVEARYVGVKRRTVRQVAEQLKVSTGTVHTYSWKGLGHLAEWCRRDCDVLILLLRQATPLDITEHS